MLDQAGRAKREGDMRFFKGWLIFFLAIGGLAGQNARPVKDDVGFCWNPASMKTLVEYLAAQDIVHGYWDGLYHPEYPCTRDQMAAFIGRAFSLTP